MLIQSSFIQSIIESTNVIFRLYPLNLALLDMEIGDVRERPVFDLFSGFLDDSSDEDLIETTKDEAKKSIAGTKSSRTREKN